VLVSVKLQDFWLQSPERPAHLACLPAATACVCNSSHMFRKLLLTGAHNDEQRRKAGPPRLLASGAAFAWNRCENAFVIADSMQGVLQTQTICSCTPAWNSGSLEAGVDEPG